MAGTIDQLQRGQSERGDSGVKFPTFLRGPNFRQFLKCPGCKREVGGPKWEWGPSYMRWIIGLISVPVIAYSEIVSSLSLFLFLMKSV